MSNSVRTNIDETQKDPQRIVRELLERTVVPTAHQQLSPHVARRVATLEREAPEILDTARSAGLEIEYLGVNPLFSESRLYGGVDTDWVLAPATTEADTVVPRRERRVLQTLTASGLQFPLIYIAHEVPKEQSQHLAPASGQGHVVLDTAEAQDLIGATPPPASSLELGERLADHSVRIAKGLRRTAAVAGAAAVGIAAAPVVLVGGAIASLAAIDPIILGAIPAVSTAHGQPAAWYVLAQWYW